jgi:tetratricopeptide (TPR) repeat protein
VSLQIPSLRVDQIRVLREFGRTSEAVALATQLYADTPDAEGVAYELGVSLLADGRVAESVPYLAKTVAVAPDNRTGRAHYGIALLGLGRTAEAETEFRAAHDLDPSYAGQLIQVARRTALNPESKASAVRLVVWYADAACRMAGDPSAEYLDTYGICLARAGAFTEAAVQAGKGSAAARKRGDDYLADRIEARAALYRAGRKYPSE